MHSRPVKQSPVLDAVETDMRRIGMGTFLGTDRRKLVEILNEDQGQVHAMGLTHETIAQRLEEITEAAKKALGEIVILGGRYEVRAEEARGKIPCPWRHPGGLFPKSHIELRDQQTGETLIWTDLSIHLIREHGFYQGKGSPYRIDPEAIKRILGI